ncbi:MAG: NeuD/PglB/VioB family sugar acetyltransferase [Microscillaceae bacterium]|nr:NeuD/PglB/VioB family sugar acetyltransferase [Microscillaceae bacterium]MDW8460622.1 NeuD/PglB/VioB family sugar acetyltransferase [Cytophagales bacterium]
MKNLLIFPLGGNSVEALDCIDEQEYEIIGFVDDDTKKIGTKYCGIEVFDRSAFERFPDAKVLACIGSPYNFRKRGEIIAGLGVERKRFVTIIHPSAKISKFATIGINCLIMAGVVITHNAKIGDNVIILPNSVIHHDTEIGDNTCIGSSVVVAGFGKIGENCYIGSGSNIINNALVGSNTLVGMGTNVVKSVGENKKIVGNPAREIQ